ncbi:regulatory protein RecX [Aquicella lusitana]|uniref:Regulatory protein RecX n=1 Tax=Aquicella lusitana TaxID=254246 RepID=A0A370GHH6_9COXI|nr:regulatory protein RecX [Aquicella lusitana]RDI42810.1 regulatory protein [Aquicella lusitana]VVC73053.1 Regulatory protein RecX [Aquicella lusitana]
MTKSPFHRTVLNWLSRRDYSQQEIRQKLKAKSCTPDEIETLIADLLQAGLINDLRFAENFVYWRSKKGYGPHRIAAELQARGIADDVIAEKLSVPADVWLAEIHKVWQKHFKGKQPTNFKERAKQIRFLQYRGFTREQVDSVLLNKDAEIERIDV